MGQVPVTKSNSYLIVGNGKLASHLKHYFSLLDIPHNIWNRKSNVTFMEAAGSSAKIILAISDGSIEPFINEYKELADVTWIHCSGALTTPLAESAHPLMTFSDELYDLDTYKSIPFITESGRKSFKVLFPELPNPGYVINPEQKSYYHAWCSIAGNFTSILWLEFFERFKSNFGIDKEALFPYLEKISFNLTKVDNPLTGPLARGDESTIKRHLLALQNDNYLDVYESFYRAFKQSSLNKEAL